MDKEILEEVTSEEVINTPVENPEQTPEQLAQELELAKQKECAEKVQVILDSYGYNLAVTGFTLFKKVEQK